jgi:protein involved in polysaccharide export with SLBB domain
MTLQDVLLQSGGLTQQAEGSRVEVSRIMDYDLSSNKLKPKRAVVKTISIGEDLVLSTEAMDFELQPFDQIFVRENPDFEAAKNIVLSGEVKYPGTYTLLSKDEKISSVIKRAGGLTNYAYMDGVKMYRKFEVIAEEEEEEEEEVNLSDELKETILSNPELAIIYASDLRKNETTQKNIFGDDNIEFAYDMVYLNLDKAMSSNNSKHNLVLIEGDSILVPKTMDVVHITGELMNLEGESISAPHFNRRRANYYVNNFAGGFTKENKKSNTVVVYPNGIAKKSMNFGLFSVSPRIKKGSTIIVSNKLIKEKKVNENPIDWNKQIENAMLKITAVLTLWLLIDKVSPQQ